MKTNLELVEFVKKAERENWGYVLGSFGNILTPTFLSQKMSQGYGVGAYNTRHQAYIRKFMNKRVSDCYGLVKACIWWNNDSVNPTYNKNGLRDRNQEGAFTAAKEKGTLATMPEIPGLVLWMKGHAGVYIGNGEFIEIAGAPRGMVRGKITNGRVAKGSPFTHWFKDTYINYVGPLKPTPPIGPVNNFHKVIKINFLGQLLTMQGVFKNDTNYIKVGNQEVPLRGVFETMGFKVGWDQVNQTILVTR